MKILFTIILASSLSTNLLASNNTRAKVVYVGTWGHGSIFIRLNTILNEPACSKNEIWIAGDNPAIKHLLSLAMTAYTADQYVHVKTNGCINGYPTIDNTNESFFHIGPR